MVTPIPQSGGLLFAAQGLIAAYLSTFKHRPTSGPGASKWANTCPPTDEYQIFVASFTGKWHGNNGDLWGLQSGQPVIGMCKEAIAKFPNGGNPLVPWHGYPVSALDNKRSYVHRPPPAVVKKWVDLGLINRFQGARINAGKV
jgi:hypothetical protein